MGIVSAQDMSYMYNQSLTGLKLERHIVFHGPLEEVAMFKAAWNDIPSIFLPTKVLELCLTVIPNPSESITNQIIMPSSMDHSTTAQGIY